MNEEQHAGIKAKFEKEFHNCEVIFVGDYSDSYVVVGTRKIGQDGCVSYPGQLFLYEPELGLVAPYDPVTDDPEKFREIIGNGTSYGGVNKLIF